MRRSEGRQGHGERRASNGDNYNAEKYKYIYSTMQQLESFITIHCHFFKIYTVCYYKVFLKLRVVSPLFVPLLRQGII